MFSDLLQCVDINSVSLYDSDVRRENLIAFGVLLWSELLTQDLQNLNQERLWRREKVSVLNQDVLHNTRTVLPYPDVKSDTVGLVLVQVLNNDKYLIW